MTTGCDNCDKIQKQTGDKAQICLSCELTYWDYVVKSAMDRIEEIKKLIKEKHEHSKHKRT
jgi:hypothetical protein